MPKTNPMYNIGRQSEHRRTAKASMLTKSQDVAEAKEVFLVRTCCPHGSRKGAKKNIPLATTGQIKEIGDVKGKDGTAPC